MQFTNTRSNKTSCHFRCLLHTTLWDKDQHLEKVVSKLRPHLISTSLPNTVHAGSSIFFRINSHTTMQYASFPDIVPLFLISGPVKLPSSKYTHYCQSYPDTWRHAKRKWIHHPLGREMSRLWTILSLRLCHKYALSTTMTISAAYVLRSVSQCIPLEFADCKEINGDSNSWILRTTANTNRFSNVSTRTAF